MKTSMVVVADSTVARVFTAESPRSPLNEIEVLAHPENRLHDRELTSDLPGKNGGKNNSGGHAYGNKVDPRQHEQTAFAKRVAAYLDDARKANQLSNLLIVATPSLLGELRQNISDPTSDKIIFELNKNLTHLKAEEISEHLPKSFKH